MTNALETFRRAFAGWTLAHSQAKGLKTDPVKLLDTLSARIGNETQQLIGSAFLNGWLETEKSAGRGYYVRETDRPGTAGGQYPIYHSGDGQVALCWELFIQLADYALLRTIAERCGLQVRLEDRLMDITVRAGKILALYVENKETKSQALWLLERMRGYGETGFGMDDIDKGNDPLRKAKYLVRDGSRPHHFALSAVGYRQLFVVEYLDGENRFRLIERPDPISAPLYEAQVVGETPARSAADSFAVELNRQLGDRVWVSPGSGETAFNVYLPVEQSSDGIILGTFENGEVWTNLKAIGNCLSEQLAICLRELGIVVDASKEWTFWVRDGSRFRLRESDAAAIAVAIANVLPGIGA
jgi:hypothetical protein